MFYLAETATKDSSVTDQVTKEVVSQSSLFKRYLDSIKWDSILANLITGAIQIAFFTVLVWIINKIGKFFIEKTFAQYRQKENLSASRVNTLHTLFMNLFHYTLLFFYIYIILSLLGIPVGTLIAGAGVVGLAIGLGAQGFISDIVTGIFILVEQQIDVGDVVKIDNIEGNVVVVGLRTTQIKGYDGTLHFIPNRNITVVSNLSRSNMRALIDVRITPEADIDAITEMITKLNQELVPHYPEIKSGPDVLGVVDLGGGNLTFRVVVYTLNGEQFRIQRDFLKAYVTALTDAGVKIPSAPINLAAK